MLADAKENELAQAKSLGIETCGRIAAFWGFTRTMGRAFGLLYLSPRPLTRAEIQEHLGISTGSASMTLGELVRWKVVHKVREPGNRHQLYTAETDFWKMISTVLNERERTEITTAVSNVDRACALARVARRRGGVRKEADFAMERLGQLQSICHLGETMLDMLLGQMALDVGRFRNVFKGDRS